MDFCSTRNSALRVSSARAILQGLAEDGGLFVPAQLPRFTEPEIMMMAAMNYQKTAETVLSAFLPDYTREELRSFVAAAYGKQFDTPQIAPLQPVRPGTYALELWHGPTCAFKDFALQLLPHLLKAAAEKCGEPRDIAILTATSGDTGKAAMEGFADVPGTHICVFYPAGGVSRMQQLQMATQQGKNVNVLAVEGNFDDAQSGVKQLFTDASLRQELADKGFLLSSANSINWGRLAPQVVYYFWAYAQLLKTGGVEMGQKVNFVVPTGNFGDILAGYLAKKAGLPVGKLICASNANNVLTEFLNTGVYNKNRPFHLTQSPSMDILISSNLERLLYLLCEDDKLVAGWMEDLRREGRYSIGETLLQKLHEEGFEAFWCDDAHAASSIRELWFDRGYLCDPHTGVAANALRQYAALTGDKTPAVIVSTASPFKFASAMLPAMDLDFSGDEFQQLEVMEIVSSRTAPAPLKRLKELPVRFDRVIPRQEMRAAVVQWLEGGKA